MRAKNACTGPAASSSVLPVKRCSDHSSPSGKADASSESPPAMTTAAPASTPSVPRSVSRCFSPAATPPCQSRLGRASYKNTSTAAVMQPSTAPMAK